MDMMILVKATAAIFHTNQSFLKLIIENVKVKAHCRGAMIKRENRQQVRFGILNLHLII
jgi:hypothetical protein